MLCESLKQNTKSCSYQLPLGVGEEEAEALVYFITTCIAEITTNSLCYGASRSKDSLCEFKTVSNIDSK